MQRGTKGLIEPKFSLYLDFFRLIAAVTVVFSHAIQVSGTHYTFPFGEDAVLGFFVLSGFVIASVADGRENDPASFMIARFARLWSVLVPTLLIGLLFALIEGQFADEGWRALMSGLFLNEIWFNSAVPGVNVSVWSIGFEFWYYVLFAVFVFSRRWRWPAFLVVGALVGPKIMLLAPAWFIGVWLYKIRHVRIATGAAWALFVGCVGLIMLGHHLHAASNLRAFYLGPFPGTPLGSMFEVRDFLWENIVAMLLAGHLIGALELSRRVRSIPGAIETGIRAGAGLTYAIYLLHYPAALAIAGMAHSHGLATIFFESLIISAVLGIFLEPLKNPLRHALANAYSRARRVMRLSAVAPK